MSNFEPYQLWLLMAAIAYVAYLFGRASARAGGDGESREARRMREQQEAEYAFSSLSPAKQADVDRLLTDGRLIQAVKLIRQESGLGLKEAKSVADHRRRLLKGSP